MCERGASRYKIKTTPTDLVGTRPVHDRTLIPFCVVVLSSKGKSKGTNVVVALVSTQMSMLISSLSNSNKQLEVVGGGVVRRCNTLLLSMHFLPEAADKILNKLFLVVTVD
jgi:RNA 3'-terminal phosphate cyclase